MRYFLLLVIFLVYLPMTHGQSTFIQECKSIQNGFKSTYVEQMKWLQHYYKTSDCKLLAENLKKVQSFTEFIPPERTLQNSVWFDDVPEMGGGSFNNSTLKDFKGKVPSFDNLKLFTEFSNITHFRIFSHPSYSKICDVAKQHKWVKRVSIEVSYSDPDLSKADVKCIKSHELQVMILGPYKPGPASDPEELEIIGIEEFRDELKNLFSYKHLKYLIISHPDKNPDLKVLRSLMNLTHLRLEISNLKGTSSLSNMPNLTFLQFYCKKCKASDLDFLATLTWLKNLDLSGNDLEDISSLVPLENLEFLNLSRNKLRTFPKLSSLHKLKYLNLSSNLIQDLSILEKARSLKTLRIDSNQITEFPILPDSVEYLAAGNNPLHEIGENVLPSQLKALNLSSTTISHSKPQIVKSLKEALETSSLIQSLFIETFYGSSGSNNYRLKQLKLDHLQKLEALTIDNNDLSSELDLSKLQALKLLKSDGNRIDSLTAPLSVRYISLFASIKDSRIVSGLLSLPNLLHLNIGGNGPLKINPLISRTLRTLELSNGNLTELPSLEGLKELTTLDISRNKLQVFPDLEAYSGLKYVDLSNNKIHDTNLALRLRGMKIDLDLVMNQITSIDDFAYTFHKSSNIELGGNPLTKEGCRPSTNNFIISSLCYEMFGIDNLPEFK